MRLAATPTTEGSRADRIVANMLEARFDDLTGASPSFRLVEPVGVLEATRADEVVAVLEAAEAAAQRGLWVAGFVSYEAAPGLDPDLVVRSRDPEDAFAALPLAWFAMFERAEETTLPLPRDDGVPPAPDGTWVPTTPRERFETAIERIRELIAAGETYQVNHTMRLRSRVEGDRAGLYRDLCYAQRGAFSAYLDLGRYRVLSASPELFFELRDGAIVTRPMKGTAPRGRWPEEDRAAAERLLASAKDRAENAMIVDLLRNDLGRISRHRLGHVGGRLPGRALRDRLAADHDRLGRARSERRARRRVPRAVPERIGHRRAEGPDDGDHPRARGLASRGLLRRGRLPRAGGVRETRTPGSTSRSAPSRWTPSRRPPSTGSAEGSRGTPTPEAEYEETVAKSRVLTARRPDFELLETMRFDPAEGRAAPRPTPPARLAGLRRLLRLPGRRRPRSARPSRRPSRPRRAAAMRVRLSLAQGRHGAGGVPRRSPSEPDAIRVAIDDVPRTLATSSCSTRRPCAQRYEEARRRHPEADDVLLVNDRGEMTESTIANVAVHVDGRWVTPPLDAGLLPGIGRAVALEDGTRGRGGGDDRGCAIGGGDRVDQRRSRMASRRDRLVALGLHREGERPHPVLFQRAVTQRAAGRLLVHEHGPLAVRAIPFSHRGRLSLFRSASASRSGGSGPLLHRRGIPPTLNQADARIGIVGPDARRPSPSGKGRRGVREGGRLRGFHLLAAAALAARDVGVDRFVLPAVVPLVVDRELGRAPGGRTAAVGLVALVGPRERPDRLAPETLLRHLVHVPSSLSPEDGSGRPSSSCDSNDARDRFIPRFQPGRGRHEDATDRRRERPSAPPELGRPLLDERAHAFALVIGRRTAR